MTTTVSASQVRLGTIEISDGAWQVLSWNDLVCGLVDHLQGDWGQVRKRPKLHHSTMGPNGPQLRSMCISSQGKEFRIITEPDRSITLIELAE